jgi:hypothetical protein
MTAELIDNPRGVLEDIVARWDQFSKLPESEKNDFIVKNGSQLITDLIVLKAASEASNAMKAKVLAKLSPEARVVFNTLSKQKELDTIVEDLQKAEATPRVPKSGTKVILNSPARTQTPPAKFVRELKPGEKITDLVNEGKSISWTEGVESAVVSLEKTGAGKARRIVVTGGHDGIEFIERDGNLFMQI